MDHKNNFDILRLFAAFNVLLQHATYLKVVWTGPLAKLIIYTSGVPVFFIISGFLITGTFVRNEGALVPYFLNRSLRIYPGLWLNLAIILVMLVAFGALPIGSVLSVDFLQYWAVLLATGSNALASWLLSSFPFIWNDALPFLPTSALWTIVLELGFYLIVPVIFLPPILRRRWASLVAVLAVTIYSHRLSNDTPNGDVAQYANPFVYFWFFGIGSTCSLLWPQIDRLFRGKFILWAVLYVDVIVATGDRDGIVYAHPTLQSTALTILLACCVISAAFTWTDLSKTLSGKDISYGIYLHHVPILMLLQAFGWHGLAGAALLIGTTAIAAIASWFAIERPALRLKMHPAERRVR